MHRKKPGSYHVEFGNTESLKNCTSTSTKCSFLSTHGKCPHSLNTTNFAVLFLPSLIASTVLLPLVSQPQILSSLPAITSVLACTLSSNPICLSPCFESSIPCTAMHQSLVNSCTLICSFTA